MEVGQIKPGMVVEIPSELLKARGPYDPKIPDDAQGIWAGAEIMPNGNVYPIIRALVDKNLVGFAPQAVPLTHKWKVVSSPKFWKEISDGLKTGVLSVPAKSVVSGSDPEVFATGGDGEVIPAWKFLKDKKGAHARDAYEPFWDGFQAEFCPEARECLQQHMDSMRGCLVTLLARAREFDPKAKLTTKSSVEVSQKVLSEATDDEVRFRCTPSLNVYRDPGNPTPQPRDYRWRFAGGHLHAGFGNKRFTTPVLSEVIKALDGILGLAGVSLAEHFDTPERRKMYGRAGEFRLPQHGIEYRVLSNFWLRHPALSHLVFELFRGTIKFAEAGLYSVCWERPGDTEIQEIINECDVKRAREILGKNQHCLVGILKEKLYTGRHYLDHRRMGENVLPLAIKTILNGLEVAIKDPEDMHKNWHLGEYRLEGWDQLCGSKGASWASVE